MNKQRPHAFRPWAPGTVGGVALWGELAKYERRSIGQRLMMYNKFCDSIRVANAAIDRMMKS